MSNTNARSGPSGTPEKNELEGYGNHPLFDNARKLNEVTHAGIVEAIREGAAPAAAAAIAGIGHVTLYRWLHEARQLEEAGYGAEDDSRVALLRDIHKAQLDMIRKQLARINKAAEEPRYWTASAWLLERRFPEWYGRRETLNLDGQVQTSNTAEELRRMLEEALEELDAWQAELVDDEDAERRQRLAALSSDAVSDSDNRPEQPKPEVRDTTHDVETLRRLRAKTQR